MSNIVTLGLHCEGTTDERFLLSVIKRTFDEVALECASQLEIYDPERIAGKGANFVASVQAATAQAFDQGVKVLCVHTDADAADDRTAFTFKINPAFAATVGPAYCEALVAVVPVRMTEAWMLADPELLGQEIGAAEAQLPSLRQWPESQANPKAVLEEAIRVALADRPRRHRDQLRIGDLYQPIGQKLDLRKLAHLPSYQKFKEAVRATYRQLNYLV